MSVATAHMQANLLFDPPQRIDAVLLLILQHGELSVRAEPSASVLNDHHIAPLSEALGTEQDECSVVRRSQQYHVAKSAGASGATM